MKSEANNYVVVQWKLPPTLSSFVQRAGRAARGLGRSGLAVLLVEKAAYDLDVNVGADQNTKSTKKKGTVRERTEYPKSKDKDYAIRHGVLRGAYGGQSDAVEEKDKVAVPADLYSIDEGLYAFVQTMACRRAVLTEVYENDKPSKWPSIHQKTHKKLTQQKTRPLLAVISVAQNYSIGPDQHVRLQEHESRPKLWLERWTRF